MPDDTLLSRNDLLQILELSGENNRVDCKGPIPWDGGEHSAELAEDITACASEPRRQRLADVLAVLAGDPGRQHDHRRRRVEPGPGRQQEEHH